MALAAAAEKRAARRVDDAASDLEEEEDVVAAVEEEEALEAMVTVDKPRNPRFVITDCCPFIAVGSATEYAGAVHAIMLSRNTTCRRRREIHAWICVFPHGDGAQQSAHPCATTSCCWDPETAAAFCSTQLASTFEF